MAAGCGGKKKAAPPPAAPVVDTAAANALWAMAPPDAAIGLVVTDRGGALVRGGLAAWRARAAEHQVGRRLLDEIDRALPADLVALASRDGGAALFAGADGAPLLVVLPRAATLAGAECAAHAGRTLCASDRDRLDAARRAHDAPLASAIAARPAAERGHVELVVDVTRIAGGGAALGDWLLGPSVLTAALRLDPGGATVRARLTGRPIGPLALVTRGVPGAALARHGGTTSSVARLHVRPALLAALGTPFLDDLAGAGAGAQLTGDFLALAPGRGVSAALFAALREPDTVAAGLARRCGGECAVPLPGVPIPDLARIDVRVVDGHVRYALGAVPPEAPGRPADLAGDAETRAILTGEATLSVWGRGFDLLAMAPPELQQALAAQSPELVEWLRLASALGAHIDDAGVAVSVRDDAIELHARVNTVHDDAGRARQAQLRADGYAAVGPVLSLVAAVALPAFLEHTRRARSAEALANVRRLFDAARAHGAPFPPSAPLTPPLGRCCAQPGQRCAPDPAAFAHPTWQALGFSLDDPHYYSYELVSNGRAFTARALGDLDCDGEYATYEMMGSIAPSGDVVSDGAGQFRDKPLE